MKRALVLLVALAFGALLFAGCRPPMPPPPLKYSEPFTCEPSFTDVPCILCLKQHCCGPARACNARKDLCECSNKCLALGPTKACAAACSDAADKTMGTCAAESCALICPGTGSTI